MRRELRGPARLLPLIFTMSDVGTAAPPRDERLAGVGNEPRGLPLLEWETSAVWAELVAQIERERVAYLTSHANFRSWEARAAQIETERVAHITSITKSSVCNAIELTDKGRRQAKCLRRGNYSFRPWQPSGHGGSKPRWERTLHAMPQTMLPPVGFAARCDWIIGSRYEHSRYPRGDGHIPHNTAWGCPHQMPRTIFLQNDELALPGGFHDTVLPCLTEMFVLIIGDADRTVPVQIDHRWPPWPPAVRQAYDAWQHDPRIAHIFVENLDTAPTSERVSPIPIGMNPIEFKDSPLGHDWALAHAPATVNLAAERPLRVLCADRMQGRGSERMQVKQLCNTSWSAVCYTPHGWQKTADYEIVDSEIRKGYFRFIQRFTFVLCVHGGGIDPNPKVFTVLLAGAIPIIRRFGGDSMYDGWPVIRLNSWDDFPTGTAEAQRRQLEQWRDKLAPYFSRAGLRRRVISRMNASYWWAQVQRHLA